MNPYLFTISFLLIMSFLTSSEVIQYAQDTLEMRCYHESRTLLASAEELREKAHLEQLRIKTKDLDPPEKPKKSEEQKKKASEEKQAAIKRSAPLKFNTSRPPNNSRINFYLLFKEDPSQQKEHSLYEITARLMRALYGEHTFFAAAPDAEYRILDKLIENKEKTASFCTPDELSTMTMDDPELQEIFYTMLKGSRNTPSLLHYITFDCGEGPLKGQRKKINMMFADPLLLKSIIQDEKTADRLIEARNFLWKEIIDQEENRQDRPQDLGKKRNDFKKELNETLTQILEEAGLPVKDYKSLFDFGLGEMGSIFFIEDTLTGQMTRSKYKNGAHTKHKI